MESNWLSVSGQELRERLKREVGGGGGPFLGNLSGCNVVAGVSKSEDQILAGLLNCTIMLFIVFILRIYTVF